MGVLAQIALWIVAQTDMSGQALELFRYATTRPSGLDPNTLLVRTGMSGTNNIEVAVLKWQTQQPHNIRFDTSRRLTLSVADWNALEKPKAVEVVAAGDNFNIRVRHRTEERFDLIADASKQPRVFRGADFGAAASTPTALAPVCAPAISSPVASLRQTTTALNAASLGESMNPALKFQYLTQLKEDFNWFERQIDDLSRARVIGQSAVQELISRMSREPKFKNDRGRAERLFMALTLYGEFRQSGEHRRLAHLFWAAESMKNRVTIASRRGAQGDRLADASDSFAVEGSRQDDFTQNTIVGAVLARSQFSCWHDDNLTAILDSKQSSPAVTDILDFVAAYDSGHIQVEVGVIKPRVTHYISPAALAGRRPGFWQNSARFKVFVDSRGNSTLPPVVRTDLDSLHSRSLVGSPAMSDESRVKPQHFEAGREIFGGDGPV